MCARVRMDCLSLCTHQIRHNTHYIEWKQSAFDVGTKNFVINFFYVHSFYLHLVSCYLMALSILITLSIVYLLLHFFSCILFKQILILFFYSFFFFFFTCGCLSIYHIPTTPTIIDCDAYSNCFSVAMYRQKFYRRIFIMPLVYLKHST